MDVDQNVNTATSREEKGVADSAVGRQGSTQKLNPYAKERDPTAYGASEDDRCLFLTFSNGYPLSQRQISNFFNREYGTCVEKVYVHRLEDKKRPPLFGKVIFKWASIPARVMAGNTQVKFVVDKKPLWFKRFHSRNNGRARGKEPTDN